MAHLSPTAVFDVQTLAAYVIFLASYLVFALGKFPGLKIDRPGAAIIGAVGMVAFRVVQPAEHWNLHRLGAFTVAVSLLSNIVSNVPAVMLLKSLAPNFANPHTAWLVLAMASTLAGNLTITGSVANIIVVESAKPETKIGFWQYFRVGLPITVMTLIVGWAWLEWVK